MHKKRALVTGCLGFIGTDLVRHLLDLGYSVHGVDDESGGDIGSLYTALDPDYTIRTVPSWCLSQWAEANEGTDKSDFVLFRDDFSSAEIISRIVTGKYDVVVHLAAHPSVEMSVGYPVSTHNNNTQKSAELFYACSRSRTKVVFASSAAVYGDDGMKEESSPCNPKSPYALQKLQCEQIAELYRSLYDLDYIALRFFNVYGPRQDGNSAYSTVMAAWRQRIAQGIPLRLDGDGEQTRDYIYIDDVVAAISTALESSCNGKFNIATGDAVSNNDVLSILKNSYEFEIENAPARVGDIKHSAADVNRAAVDLKFTAKVSVEDGIKIMFSGLGGENV